MIKLPPSNCLIQDDYSWARHVETMRHCEYYKQRVYNVREYLPYHEINSNLNISGSISQV